MTRMVKILSHMAKTTYYAGIMPDAFKYLLCQNLCRHNWPGPSIQVINQRNVVIDLFALCSSMVGHFIHSSVACHKLA